MSTAFEKLFNKMFHWFSGSEAQFLHIMRMLNKIGNSDWITDFHNVRITALVLNKCANSGTLIRDIVETASNNNWFEPYARAFHRSKVADELSHLERIFLLEITHIERESLKKRTFSELWFNWREVKMLCIKTAPYSCLPNFGIYNIKKEMHYWKSIQRESADFRRNFNFDCKFDII